MRHTRAATSGKRNVLVPEPAVTIPAEPAELSHIGDLLARLAPALDGFLAAGGDAGFPP